MYDFENKIFNVKIQQSTRHPLKPAVLADHWTIIIILSAAVAFDLGLHRLMILRVKHAARIFKVLASHDLPPNHVLSG